MSTGEIQPPPSVPTADNDGDGINNATEVAIDTSARYQARIALITAIDVIGAAGTFSAANPSPTRRHVR